MFTFVLLSKPMRKRRLRRVFGDIVFNEIWLPSCCLTEGALKILAAYPLSSAGMKGLAVFLFFRDIGTPIANNWHIKV